MRRDRRHQGVLGRRHARLVEKDIGALELAGAEFEAVGGDDLRAELLEGEKMGVEPAPSDDIAAGRRQGDLAAAREQRPGQQDRGTDAGAELRVELGGAHLLGVDHERIALTPIGRLAPTERMSSTSVSVSRMRGTFSSVT